ncbi:BamA/TamA family outer membrane protein [Filimonas effusa]|uniref:Bacterial surface antigen (D15) domain-containing protein n=1 Tax=Filimonas effusa TaxID=2508721 RepID=A0A4Q1DBH4_9BACT|nr:BamA/TamA family outer membrane protein [Filimonas effusa]RXK85859.1 hypothetical protein ESB13_03350 [Filimonas effusa]
MRLTRFITSLVLLLSLQAAGQQARVVPDSITVAIAPGYDSVTGVHRFLFGESYRKLWAAPVKMKVFYLQQEKGGLKILQRGGGMQTKSLRLADANGKEWVLRTIQKYPERGLPEQLRPTIVKDILQDQVVTAHPYSSVTVPPLAAALGIPHANPQIVYVPDDSALGAYRADFANAVFLFEEREPLDADRTDNTEKTQRKLEEDNDVRVDQEIVLRARLLDMLLGDWDRHEDQWRWERRKDKKAVTYTPVPRDRDQVYYNTTGVFPWLVSHQWLMSKFQGYHDKIRDINGFNIQARFFDRYFLNELDAKDWKKQIAFIQSTLTDSLIRQAVSLMPDTIFKLNGEHVIKTMIARRESLAGDAMKYYAFISKYADIPGSDKQEYFEIKKQKKGHITVSIYKVKKDGSLDQRIYKKEFTPKTTKEIRLYGLDGTDRFRISGDHRSPIRVRLIGGDGPDSFSVGNEVAQRGRIYIYDRSDQPNQLPPRSAARIRTEKDSLVNAYNKRSFVFDRLGPLFMAQYNPDQGLLVRTELLYEQQGFRKVPYAQQHQLMASYFTGRKAFLLQYTADYKKLIGKNDLRVNILSRGPQNLSNFFGLGNNSSFPRTEDKEIEYYRSRYDLINGDVRLYWPLGKHLQVNAGLAAQYYTSKFSNNTHRFLGAYNAAYPEQQVFADRFYAGIAGGWDIDTRNNLTMPYRGVHWQTELTGMRQMNGGHKTFGRLLTDFSFYTPLIGDSTLVLANRVGLGTTIGKPAYFQMMQLGGAQLLRGFHTARFTGKTLLYHNLEVRLKLFDFASYLFPGSVGLIGFNDIGRVWLPGESSSRWHDGYGGGFYLIPAQLFIIQATAGFSREGTLPYIMAGFRF